MAIKLEGQPIAITGASSGIGWHTAIACARVGMPVAVGARREERLVELVTLIQKSGGRAIAVKMDVESPEDCDRLIARTVEAFGSIHAVFANAGYGIEAAAHEATDQQIREIFETNFFGTLNTIRPALRKMLEARSGHVLMCSSCLSKLGIPMLSYYTSTKAAQDHVARAMRVELAGTGVRVSTVHPIGTRTELSSVLREKSGTRDRVASSPKMFTQEPDVVAGAVVRCLRKPVGEVWTSTTTRWAFAAANAMPRLADWVLMKKYGKRSRERSDAERE